MKNKKLRVLLTFALVAVLTFVIAFSFTASALITDAELTAGRAFEDGEGIQIGRDLDTMPRTYEAVVYVPADVDQKGAILSNFFPTGSVAHIDFSISMGGSDPRQARPTLDICDENGNRTVASFRTDVRGDQWMHIVITHQQNGNGDVYTCYVNGSKVSKQTVNYYVEGVNTAGANFTYDLDMELMQQNASMYLGQAYAYSSATELGAEDPYNNGKDYVPTNFKGRIKNVAVYSDILTESEIKANYNSGINAEHEDIMLCYDLTEKEAKSGYITDLSGNGYDTVPLYHERTEELDPDSYDYAFALLGDTQFLVDWDVKNGTSYTADIFNWLVANKDAKKIAHVLGVGDIVESGRLDEGVTDEADREHAIAQWEYAVSEYAKLEAAGIPYTITWGYNHDGYYGEEFTTYFGNSENFTGTDVGYYFSDASSEDYGKRLANYYRTFEVCGVKYMVMCIEYRPNDAVLTWADAVIKANPDCKVIINTHYFLDKIGGIATQYTELQAKWDKLANENKNVEMILCGHVDKQNNIIRSYTVAKSGQTVAQFLLDPQQMDRFYGYDNTGVVAMFYFSNGGKDVRVELISTAASMRAKEENPDAEDILYGRRNEFSFGPAGEKKPAGSMGEVDIYIIAGQSNAVGYGRGEVTVSDDRFTNGFENVLYYGDHEYYGGEDIDGFISVKLGLGQGTNRSGAEIGIAYKLDGNGRTTVVIKCAQGATPLYPIEGNTTLEKYGSWTSPSYMEKYPELVYHEMVGAMYERLIATLTGGMGKLEADGYTLNVKGIFWMQGEADTGKAQAADAYEEMLTDLITDLRGDLTEISGKDCSATPFVVGEITSNHISAPAYLDTVCAAQTAVAEKLENVYVLDTTGLEQQDSWHYVTESQRIIGERFTDIVSGAYGNYVTPYGEIPAGSYDPVNKPLAVFADGKYLESFAAFDKAMNYISTTIGLKGQAEDHKTAELVLLADYTSNTYWNTSHVGGKVVIDLNGFTLNCADSGILLHGGTKTYTSGKLCNTNITVKNGNITVKGKSITEFFVSSDTPDVKTFTYTFENVKFSFREDATVTNLTTGLATSAGDVNMKVDLTFNGCTFDLSTNAKSEAKLFALNKAEIIANVKINGGKIVKDTCAGGSLFSVDSADTVTFGKYNGEYTELVLPTDVTPASEKFSANGSYSGNLMFAKAETGTDSVTYQLVEITTKYGDIPEKYLSPEDYPFIVFVFDGDKLDGSKTKGYALLQGNNNAIHYAKNSIEANVYSETTGYDGQLSSVILMRRDYMLQKSEIYYNHGQIRGVVTYDLGGYTLHQSTESGAKSIMYVQTKPYGTYDVTEIAPSFVRVINGNMVTYSAPILTLAVTPSTNANYTIGDKKFGITFENVNFSLGKGATATTLMLGYASNAKPTDADPDPMAKFDIDFKDCNIDLFYNVPTSNFELFNLAPTVKNAACVNVKFYGGHIRCREWDGSGNGNNIKVWKNAATNGSAFCFEKSEVTGEYLKLLMTPGADAPSADNVFYTSDGSALNFVTVSNTDSSYVYTLKGGEKTKYGTIPGDAGSATEYPFALFIYPAGSDTPVFIGVYKELLGSNNGVFNDAKNLLQDNEWNGSYDGQIRAVILMRGDYTLGEGEYFSNFAQIRGEIILDLGGHTLSQYSSASAKPLFEISSKPWGADGMGDGHTDVFPSTITIENGTILTYNGAIFKLSISSTSGSPESLVNKLFTVNMNGVTIGLREGATATELMFTYGNASTGSDAHDKDIAPFVFNLNDCVIDLDTVKPAANMTIFNINGASKYVSATVNMKGGSIKVDTLDGVSFFGKIGNGSSLTFIKGECYTVLNMNAGATAPAIEFDTDAGKMYFTATENAGEFVLTVKVGCDHKYDNACDTDCNLCGEVREIEHDYDYIVVAPECTTQGYTIFICYYCDYTYTGAYTDALGHSYNAVVTAPTCTAGGYATYTCTACGDTYIADETAATGHSYDNDLDADCNDCGDEREIAAVEGALSGKLTWSYADGVLSIVGRGKINNFNAGKAPWYALREYVTAVEIGDGVTYVGISAFYGFTALDAVNIPNSVTAIGNYAFYGCTSLKNITIPENVTEIGAFAFRRSGVENVTFAIGYGWSAGNNTFTLDEIATGGANYLAVGFYKSVWTRDVTAEPEIIDPNFVDGGICGNNIKWTVTRMENGKLKLTVSGEGAIPEFSTAGAPWFAYWEQITEIEVCDGVTYIGRCAFYGLKFVRTATIADTVTAIGDYGFYMCYLLKEIELSEGVTAIGTDAFKKTGLTVIPTV